MKKNIMLIVFLTIGTFIVNTNVYAKENVFYENEKGVVLTNEEYNFISDMYWDGYQKYLTQEDYQYLKKLDVFTKDVKKQEIIISSPVTRGDSVTSNLRRVTISKACSNACVLTLTTTWLEIPFIKSYDVVGARVLNSKISSIRSALVSGENYAKTYSSPQTFENGFGFSILVPNVANVKTTLTFITDKSGMAYGSYQHATINISEFVSKQYTIGAGEYGNVFHFMGNARNAYDNAPGVDISLS